MTAPTDERLAEDETADVRRERRSRFPAAVAAYLDGLDRRRQATLRLAPSGDGPRDPWLDAP